MATAAQNTGPAQYVDPVTGHPRPPLGTVLTGTNTIVAFTGKRPAADGSYAYGVGLFVRPESYQPYVVWTVILRPATDGGPWVVENGSYCETIGEAVAEYERRGGET